MRTKKPISTISYNSYEFLKTMLDDLLHQQIISFYSFIKHFPEELEDHTMEKPHFHVYVEPHGQVDTMELCKLSQEFDPEHPEKPLKCIYWRTSDWPNWLLYALHDETYLKLKLEKRDKFYSYDDFDFSDPDEFFERYNDAVHSSTIASMLRLPKLLKTTSVPELVALGYVKPEQACQFSAYEKLLKKGNQILTKKRILKHE